MYKNEKQLEDGKGTFNTLLDTAYRARMDKNFRGEGKGCKVECGECDTPLGVGLLAGHMAKQHHIYQLFVLD